MRLVGGAGKGPFFMTEQFTLDERAGKPAQFTLTNGLWLLLLRACLRAPAVLYRFQSLQDMRTVASVGATSSACRNAFAMDSLRPPISPN